LVTPATFSSVCTASDAVSPTHSRRSKGVRAAPAARNPREKSAA
jgi:hypothetical protein